MLVIREVFIAKPGKPGELAELIQRMNPPEMKNAKVMLDSVTDYNKIVLEYEVEDMDEFEKIMNDTRAHPSQHDASKPEHAHVHHTRE
jgi:hypothetical protein